MADGGKVIIKIDGDDSGFKKAMGGLGKISKTALKGIAVGAAGASVAIAGIGKSAISAYADYEQLVGGVETLFKNSSDIVMNYANQAYQSAGLSANQYMETITGFSASLLQSLGSDTVKAAEYGNRAVVDMSDNANKMGTDIQRIQDAYQGFAKQNFTMLDNLKLGYGGTKTEMERLLKDAEKLSGLKFDISSFADITEAIHIVQTEMGITGTTAKEAATTIQGSAKMMKSAWKNLLTGITDPTQDFDKLLDNLIESVKTFASNILPAVKNALSGVGKLIEKGITTIIKNADTIIATAKDTLISFVNSVTSAIPALKPLGAALTYVIQNFEKLTKAVIAGIAAYKALQIIQTISAAYQAAIPAITAYTVATQASQNVSLLMASTMKPLEILFGVLTGKIQLQTAATLALAAAKKLLTDHIGLVIAGITAAVIAIGTYIAAQNKEKNNAAAIIEQAKERQKVLADEKQAYDELIQTQVDQATADLAQVAQTQVLYEELQRLVGVNGEVNEANRARVDFILGELNSAYGTEYQLIDGVIQGYQGMQTEIDNLIAKRKYEIAEKAALPVYEEAMTNAIQRRMDAERDAAKVEEQRMKVQKAQKELEEARGNPAKYEAKLNALADEKKALEELEETSAQSSAAMKRDVDTLSKVQEASFQASKGNYEEAGNILMEYSSDFHKRMSEASGDIEEQKRIAKEEYQTSQSALKTYLDNVANGTEQYNETIYNMLKSHADTAKEEAEKIGVNIGDGMIGGMAKKVGPVAAKAGELANSIPSVIKKLLGIHSPSRVMRDEVGAMIDEGIAVGIDENASEVEKALNSMNETMLESEYKYLAEKQRLEDEAAAKALQKKYDDAEKELKQEKEKAKDAAAIREAEAKYAEKIEKIKQDEINDAQEKAQDAYLAQLKETADREKKIYEARQKDIENAKQAIKDNFKALAEAAFDSIEEIESAEANLADKLKSFGDLYTTRTVERGNGKTYEIVKLADIEKQTKALEDYADKLLAVKERGDVPQEFFATLRDLSVEEGTKFADALLKADDKAFNKYIEDWKAKQKAADEISKVLYADEAQAAKDEIERSFNEFDTDLTRKGTQNAEAWGNAFFNEIKRTMPKVLAEIYRSFDGIVNTPSFAVSGGGGTVKNYSTYNHYDLPKVEVPVNLGGREVDRLIYNSYNNELKRMGK